MTRFPHALRATASYSSLWSLVPAGIAGVALAAAFMAQALTDLPPPTPQGVDMAQPAPAPIEPYGA